MRGERNSRFLFRGSLSALLVNGSGKLLALAVAALLAVQLGAEGFGVYSVAISWVTVIAMFAALGFPTLLLREMSTGTAEEDWPRMRGVLRFAGGWVLVVSILCALAGAALAWASFSSNEDAALRVVIMTAMILVPLRAFSKIRNGTLRGLREVVLAQLPEQCIRPGAMLTFVVLAVWLSTGQLNPLVAIFLQILAGVVSLAFGTWWLLKAVPRDVWRSRPKFHRRSWAASATHMLLFSSMTILLAQSGVVTMGFLADEASVGVFALGVRLSEALMIFMAAVNVPLMPIIARLHAEGRAAEIQRYLRLGVICSLSAVLPVGIALIFGGEFVMGQFGEGFGAGASALKLLVIAQLLNTAFGPVGLLLNVSGNERAASHGISFAALLNIVLCVVLVPSMQAEGAAWAMLIATLAWNIWLSVVAWRRMGILPGILWPAWSKR